MKFDKKKSVGVDWHGFFSSGVECVLNI